MTFVTHDPLPFHASSHTPTAQVRWADLELRTVQPAYVHSDFVPAFDGAASGAKHISFPHPIAIRDPRLIEELTRDLPNCPVDLSQR